MFVGTKSLVTNIYSMKKFINTLEDNILKEGLWISLLVIELRLKEVKDYLIF